MRKIILPALLVLLTLAARLIPGPRTVDDSYITFRYARNLLAGNGFVFNPGERVQGTTTPLYTLLMTGLGAVTGGTEAPFPELALGVNALADAGTVLLLLWLGKRAGSSRAGLGAGLAWAVHPYSVTFAIGGLETSVYVLLLVSCAAAFAARRRVLTVMLGVLALLTRPDALILLGPLALDRLVRAVRKSGEDDRLKAGEFAALLPATGWCLFATVYFGSPLAHSMQAKLNAYRLEPTEALVRLVQHYATPFMEQNWLGPVISVGLGVGLYSFLYLAGARRAYQAEPRLLALLAYPWLYFAVFAISKPLIFRWYLTPPLPIYLLVILLGADELFSRLLSGKAGTPLPRWRAVLPLLLVTVVPVILLAHEWQLHPDHGPDRPAPAMAYIKLELLYRQAAETAAPELSNGQMLAAGDVGVLGYTTRAHILDTVGLNSAESMPYYPLDPKYYAINYAIAPDLILDQKPAVVIFLEIYGRESLLKDERFLQEYRLIEKIPTSMYGSDGVLIYAEN